MRTVVTGGAGFIGSHLVDRLLGEGHEVVVIDDLSTGSMANLARAEERGSGRLIVHRHDIGRPDTAELIALSGAEVVFHLAAQADVRVSVARPEVDAGVNIIGSLHVFEGAVQGKARKVVFAGSGGTLYGAPTRIPTPESEPQRPLCPYGVAKKAAGDYLHYYREVRGLDSTILALANVYGPRQDFAGEAGVIALFSRALLTGVTPTIFGDGEQTRDFVFVSDVAEAFLRAARTGGGVLANVGTGHEVTVNGLFTTMAGVTGFAGEPHYAPARPGEVRRSALDPGSARRVLGWSPQTTLPAGLEQTIRWVRTELQLMPAGSGGR